MRFPLDTRRVRHYYRDRSSMLSSSDQGSLMHTRVITRALTVALVLGMLSGPEASAQAPRLVDGTGLEWFFTDDVAADASFVGAVAADTSGGGTHLSVLADAFDGYGALAVAVDGGSAVAYASAWTGATECNGRQMVLPATTVNGVTVSRKVYVPAADGFARWLNIVTNTSGATKSVQLHVSGNLGSDAGTTIGATSSGDAIADTSDLWVTTYKAFQQDASSAPRIAHVLQSPGAAAPVVAVAFANGSDTPSWTYQTQVPAGATIIVMHYAAGLASIEDAGLKAAQLASLPPGSLTCMSAAEQQQVVNMQPGVIPSGPQTMFPAGVTITSPTTAPSFSAGAPFLTLGGTAGPAGLESVTWSSDRGFSGTALGSSAWTIPAARVLPGANTITVHANYVGGHTLTDTLSVSLDTLTYMLPEGSTGSFFSTDVLIANPNDTEVDASVRFIRPDGGVIVQVPRTLAPHSRTTISLDEQPGLANVGALSTIVTAAAATPLVVERTMFWDDSGYGSHGAMALDGPRTRFVFAEGSQGFFDTYLLLANPNSAPAQATVTFYPEGSVPVIRTYTVPATSRFNVYAGTVPELANRSFSIALDSDLPIVAERAMYFGTPLFNGGHDSPGVSTAATRWQFAEGASGSFFDTYYLLGNATARDSAVVMTYQLPDGTALTVNRTVPAYGRLTVLAENEHPSLADTSFGLSIVASEPITAERSMYWSGNGNTWFEAHNAFGTNEPGMKWGLAEGRVGTARNFETFILIGNASMTDTMVRVTFLRTDGSTVLREYMVGANSRFNVFVNAMVPELADEEFGAVVEVLQGGPVTVERSLYNSTNGVQFAGGTTTQAVRLP